MADNPQQIEQLLDFIFRWGPGWVYATLFFACFIENVFPPFPGDTFVVAAGALVGLDRLHLVPTVLIVNVGGMMSTMFMYYLGRRFGRSYFLEKDYRYFPAEDILRMENAFTRWGAPILIVSRFVVGMRVALAIAAGIARYPVGLMVLFSAISYLLFTGLLIYAAMVLVENLDTIRYYFDRYNSIVWPLVAAIVILVVVRQVRKARKARWK